MRTGGEEGWREIHDGGSPEAEAAVFRTLAAEIGRTQAKIAARARSRPARTFHAKIVVGVTNARLIVAPDLPPRFAVGYFQPGAERPVAIRCSNASPIPRSDAAADMRGIALKIDTGADGAHDLLMTSYPVSHARNARQFVTIARIATGPKRLVLPRLLLALGLSETIRVIRNIRAASIPSSSLALTRFWSRAPILWGEAGPVRYLLRPAKDAPPAPLPRPEYEYLAKEFAARLSRNDVRYRLFVQPFVDPVRTPIEDGAIEWLEAESPPIEIATIVIPRQDLATTAGVAARTDVDGLAFTPWNSPVPFRPLGNLNRARRAVYAASAKGWMSPLPPGR